MASYSHLSSLFHSLLLYHAEPCYSPFHDSSLGRGQGFTSLQAHILSVVRGVT